MATVIQTGTEWVEYQTYRTPTGWALSKRGCWESSKFGNLYSVQWRRYYKSRDKAEESLARVLGDTVCESQRSDEWGTWVRLAPS
jgi:hypothetical protein